VIPNVVLRIVESTSRSTNCSRVGATTISGAWTLRATC